MLEGRTVLVTGAGGVLGTSHVAAMLGAGARVLATELPGDRLEALRERHGASERFRSRALDVTDEGQVAEAFAEAAADGWLPSAVVNNAAVTPELAAGEGEAFPDFADSDVETFERTLRVNLTGAYVVARQVDRDVAGKHEATLVNVASMYALRGPHHEIYEGMPFKSMCAYSVSKAGVHGLTVWLAGLWAARGVTVNTLAPGAVFNGHDDEFRKRVSGLTMLGRMAEPQEISDVLVFLCSDKARYMTGQFVSVDGGFSAW